jgi:hypothetical protein
MNSNKIIPNEYNTWHKYIQKIYNLFEYYSFTLIKKNNVERIYKNDNITIKTLFKFEGLNYKERKCNLFINIDNIIVVNDFHYRPKILYKNLKNYSKKYFSKILIKNKYNIYNSKYDNNKFNHYYNDFSCFVNLLNYETYNDDY